LSEPAEFEHTLRPGMIYQTISIWRMSEGKINTLVEDLSRQFHVTGAASRLQESYGVLNKIIETLAYDREYLAKENSHTFKTFIENLDDVFKYLFESFFMEHKITCRSDSIVVMNRQFHDTLAEFQNLQGAEFVLEGYTPVTILVKFLRNCHKHQIDRPQDHITGEKTFGNLYTVSSIIILSVYGYLEILQAWVDTIKIMSSPRSVK
jgi:hypothetical protein